MRRVIVTVVFLLLAAITQACAVSVAGKDLLIRPGVRVHSGAVENPDAERTTWETFEPRGDSMIIFIRGRL
jgi:hypothetical protein